MQVKDIPLDQINADYEWNTRGEFQAHEVMELAQSIREKGLLQPVTIAPTPDEDRPYKLICGYRRYKAHQVNKAETIPAHVYDKELSAADALALNMQENLQRKELDIVQEARALSQLKKLGCTQQEVMDRLNVNRGWVQLRYMVLDLPEPVHHEIKAGMITQTQIRDLYTILKDHKDKPKSAAEGAIFDAVKLIKESKQKGKKHVKLVKKNKKKIRNASEIMEMNNRLMEMGKAGIHTKVLAWASGEVHDDEIEEYLKVYFEDKYITPDDFDLYYGG